MTEPNLYIKSRVSAIRRIMYQKALTQEEINHVCSTTSLRKMYSGNDRVRMSTADKLYQYLIENYNTEYRAEGVPFKEWHDTIFNEMEAYRQKIGMRKSVFANILGIHSVQYYDLIRGVRVSGKKLWEAYQNYKRWKI